MAFMGHTQVPEHFANQVWLRYDSAVTISSSPPSVMIFRGIPESYILKQTRPDVQRLLTTINLYEMFTDSHSLGAG
jgi:hypothetical protein